jgi:hypothetical protein
MQENKGNGQHAEDHKLPDDGNPRWGQHPMDAEETKSTMQPELGEAKWSRSANKINT